jgi:hypothetical protein
MGKGENSKEQDLKTPFFALFPFFPFPSSYTHVFPPSRRKELKPFLQGLSMIRRQFLYGLLMAPLALVSAGMLFADQTILDAGTMKKILRPPTPDDSAFIDRVVDQVKKGKLPADLVDSTLHWARKKSKRRFQYFKQALILRAAQQGIVVQS